MRKVLTIASRDYRTAVFSKAFLIGLIASPVLLTGIMAVLTFFMVKVDTADRRVAIVDRTGKLVPLIVTAAEQRNAHKIFIRVGTERHQMKPRFIIETVSPGEIGEPPQSTLKLSDRVRTGELLAFVDISADLLEPESGPESVVAKPEMPDELLDLVDVANDVLDLQSSPASPAKIVYHSNSPTYIDFSNWLKGVLNKQIQDIRFGQTGLDRDLVHRANRREAIKSLGLVSLDKDGNITDADNVNLTASLIVPVGMMLLMWITVFVGSMQLFQSVLEEKMSRIAEVLLSSVTPFQWMLGKLIGGLGISLTVMAPYTATAYLALWLAGVADLFPTHLLLWFIVFQALGVVMYGPLFLAIGAASVDPQEAQFLLLPAMIVVTAPIFVFAAVINEPSSTFSTIASLFPPLTPTLMILRQSIPPGVPLWQPLVGIVLVLLTTIAGVWAAGRVFRVAILAQGKGASFRQICRWIIQG